MPCVPCHGKYRQPLSSPPQKHQQAAGALRAPTTHMSATATEIEGLTERVIGCAIEVHRTLGPGLLESVYRDCMIIELRREHLRVERERCVRFEYKGERIRDALKLDL